MVNTDERGQIQTIEGVIAAFIVVIVLAVIVETTSVTPLSSSFTNQHIKLELQNTGNDILSTLDQIPWNPSDPESESELKLSVINWAVFDNYTIFTWNNSAFISAADRTTTMTDSELTRSLKFALISNGTAFNLELRYPENEATGNVRTTKMIWNGDPSENSVTVSRYITLSDKDLAYDDSVVPDVSASSLHTTAEVRLTLWVM